MTSLRHTTLSLSRPAMLGALVLLAALTAAPALAQVKFNRGDHVTYVGNNLADRKQHVGWLETYIQARFPKLDLSFRNIGFTGDELDKRPRSSNFGSPDQWLTRTQTNVVFAFFGYNEAFAGEGGLSSFKSKLASFVDHTRKQKYDGKTTARLVLFSPIAHEDLKSPHLPDGKENNARLALYTKAMAEVAQEKNVPFVNLFDATLVLYDQNKQPLTINGVHLNPEGSRLVAQHIDRTLFGSPPSVKPAQLEKLRQAVVEKNFHWFNLYRTVDGYNVYGGRSRLAWHGQSNYDVMQREMDIFEVMTANRDKRVWAVARGGDMKVDDSNAPPLLEVKTNRPGKLEGGKYPYISGEEGLEKMTMGKGLEVNLFADEKRFPDLVNPVQMAVDTDSRLWVATWPTYPHWNPKEELADKLVILPDEDGDGKADRLIVFADGLNSVTGFEFWGGGVLVAAAPELLFLKDTDGDDRADVKIRMLQGVSSADTHHTANALVIGVDGALYWSRGVFHVTNMETPTRTFRSSRSGVYRFDPRTFEINFHFPIGPNPHGDVFDQWGYQFANDGTGGTGNYVSIGKGVGSPKKWFTKRVRPVPATGILSSSHFPDRNNGNFLICNAIGFRGILQHHVKYNGADITAEEIEPLLSSADPNFRPTDVEVGGDGALYVSDWCNALIGHMQHNIRDPNRDHLHGRVYRVTATGRPLLKPVKMKGKPINDVLGNFFAKENSTRYRARLELSGRETAEVTSAVTKWADKIDPASGPWHEQALLEGLWVFAEHRVPNRELLVKVFGAKEPRVRAAAIRTLGHFGPRIKDWEPILLAGARDPEPLVRHEAVVAAPMFEGLAAADAIFEVATRPTDVQIDFALNYARGKINVDKIVQDALQNGQTLSKAAKTYALQKANVATLLKMERSTEVYEALLVRGGVPAQYRTEALTALAKKNNTTPVVELLAAIHREEVNPRGGLGDLLVMLTKTDAAQLKPASNKLAALADKTESPQTRRSAYAAWLKADGSGEKVYQHAVQSVDTLRDLLNAYATVDDAKARASLYPKVRSLMFELPSHLKPKSSAPAATFGAMRVAYYEPYPGSADLNAYAKLKPKSTGKAKVFKIDEAPLGRRDNFALVFTGGINVPRSGKYTFYTSSDDGSRLYIDGRQVVNNDGNHGMSEKSGSLNLSAGPHQIVVTYFDSGGGDGLIVSWQGPGIKKQEIPAGVLSGSGGGTVHDLAIAAVAATEGHQQQKIDDFTKLIIDGQHVPSALAALAGQPRNQVMKRLSTERVDALIGKLIERADKATPVERETSAYGNALRLGDSLSASASNKGDVRRKLRALRDSIPVQADPNVMALGREVYLRDSHCGTCHQLNGRGLPSLYPTLDGSSWVTGSQDRLIRLALHGMYGTITVKGETFSSPPLPPMTGFKNLLNDEEMAAVLTFVRNSWSNRAAPIDAKMVAQVRKATGKRTEFWHAAELAKMYPPEKGSNVTVAPADTSSDWAPKFVKNWQVSDFEKELTAATLGKRSFEQGRLAFNRLGCVQCHKIAGQGGALGPDLSEVFKKLKGNRRDLLTHVLEPSRLVEEKYKSHDITTKDGDRYFGLVTAKTGDHLMIVTNAQNPVPLKIDLKSIESDKVTPLSLMPQGLLSLLTKEQVLDLLAYLEAGGDAKHAVFGK